MMNKDLKSLGKTLGKNKYVLILAVLALVLIAFPSGNKNEASSFLGGDSRSSSLIVDEESAKIGEVLSSIEGVGETKVLLSSNGAVIVCEGAASSSVRLYVTNAVSVYTGLGSDKIEVIKMN